MTKKDFIEGGLVILGVGFMIWGVIYLVMNASGWIFSMVMGNRQTVFMHFAPDFIRMLLANIVQCIVGYYLIVKNGLIADWLIRHEKKT